MLQRILEPEVMDSAEEARDYDQMDHADVNRRFVDDLLRRFFAAPGEFSSTNASEAPPHVLDLGTGTALIPIELCRRLGELNSSVRFNIVAADAAAHMLALADKNIGQAGLSDTIRTELVDAKGLPFDNGAFGVVMSNSIIHHIPDPQTVVSEALRVAAPGALIFFRDLLRPADEATLARLVAQYAADANTHQKKMFAESLHAALTVAEMQALVAAHGCSLDDVRATSDRHWTWVCRRPVGS